MLLLSCRLSTTFLFRKPACVASQIRVLRQLPCHVSSVQYARSKLVHDTRRSARNALGAFRPELARFLNKAAATPLVQTSSPVGYRIGLCMLGAFCFTFSIINFTTIIWDPLYPPTSFVKGTFVSIDIAMAIFGTYSLLKMRRIVSSMSVVPYTVNINTGQKGLALRIETHRTIPGLRRKVIEVPADTVTTSDQLGVPGSYVSTPFPPTPKELKEEQRWIKEQQRKTHKNNIIGIIAIPFERFGQLFVRGFMGLRDLFTEDSFVHLKITGRNGTWKVDRDFVWALDNGHAFDQVVKPDLFH